jgi:UDP-N-acetylmuramoylalanine-D-glutamate ligase
MAKEEVILPCSEATLVGRHNYMNILAATALEKMILINIQNQKILVWLKRQSYRIYVRILMIIKFIFEKASLIVVVC